MSAGSMSVHDYQGTSGMDRSIFVCYSLSWGTSAGTSSVVRNAPCLSQISSTKDGGGQERICTRCDTRTCLTRHIVQHTPAVLSWVALHKAITVGRGRPPVKGDAALHA